LQKCPHADEGMWIFFWIFFQTNGPAQCSCLTYVSDNFKVSLH